LVFDGKRIAGRLNILDIKLGGLLDVLERFLAGITLRNATRQARNDSDITPVTFALQDHRVTHACLLMENNSILRPFRGRVKNPRQGEII